MSKKSVVLSIVIPVTWENPEQIRRCFSSVFTMRQKKIEVIVIDQSQSDFIRKELNRWKDRCFIYRHVTFANKSKALNLGTKLATANIVAHTDQDCIVDKDWADKILDAYKQHPDVAAITGKVMPYKKTRVKGRICPSLFLKNSSYLIAQPSYHYDNIGIGSNFSIKKSVFKSIGDFKEWLGPGSNSFAAEDAEMLLRLLIHKHKIWYCHDAVVYHDKWLGTNAYRKSLNHYAMGGMACYGYLFFRKQTFARSVIFKELKESFAQCSRDIENLDITRLKHSLKLLQSRFKGLIIGCYHAFDK